VFDFYEQLTEHPDYLKVLGDGTARKSYLYVQDLPRRDAACDERRTRAEGKTSR